MDGEMGGGWRRRADHMLPFIALVVFTYGLALVPPMAATSHAPLAWSIVCFLTATALVIVVPWSRIPQGSIIVPTVLICLAIGLLRHSAGGSSSGYGGLLLLPVIWQALYGRRWELAGTLGAVAATYAIPIVLIGGPQYPPSQWRNVVMSTTIAATVGLVVEHLNRSRDRLLAHTRAQAEHDDLTGLVNRRQLSRLLDRLVRQERPGALAVIDLDHFKQFNDTHGHVAGDRALVTTAERWRQVVRHDDVISRWGGEEFVVVFPDSSLADAEHVLDLMAEAMPAGLTFSAGVVTIDAGDSVTDVVGAADLLLYGAKEQGRDRILSASRPGGRRPRRRGRPTGGRGFPDGRAVADEARLPLGSGIRVETG